MKMLLPGLALFVILASTAADKKNTVIPSMGKIATFPVLYTANNENWTSVAVILNNEYRTINARASDLPKLVYVMPGDNVNIVLQEDDDQAWVLGFTLVTNKGNAIEIETSKADVITNVDSDGKTAVISTRKQGTYKVNLRLAKFKFFDGKQVISVSWMDHLTKGSLVKFNYLSRESGNWVTSATKGRKHIHNTHADKQIVQYISKGRTMRSRKALRHDDYWYYVYTQFPDITYEVDSRWNTDVRTQEVGQPPMWHKNREPSPYGELGVIGRPVKSFYGSSLPVVNVNVAGDTVTNRVVANTHSTNNVTGTNTSTNKNENVSSNKNENVSSNKNENSNTSSNDNKNDNQNDNNSTSSNHSSLRGGR